MSVDESSQLMFRASFARARSDPAFLDRFYVRFIASSPQVAALFEGRDVSRISRKLASTLELLSESASSKPGFDLYLDLLGRTHSRFHITPSMFDAWRSALMETVRDCDPAFDERTEAAWNQIIRNLLDALKHPDPPRSP